MVRTKSRVSAVVVRGPLSPFVDGYRQRLDELRYTPLSTVNLLRQVARLSGWMAGKGLVVEQLCEANIEAFVVAQRDGGCHRSSLSRPGLLCLLEVLRELGVVGAPVLAAPSATEAFVDSFGQYLLAERGLSAGTVRGYVGMQHDGLDTGSFERGDNFESSAGGEV